MNTCDSCKFWGDTGERPTHWGRGENGENQYAFCEKIAEDLVIYSDSNPPGTYAKFGCIHWKQHDYTIGEWVEVIMT